MFKDPSSSINLERALFGIIIVAAIYLTNRLVPGILELSILGLFWAIGILLAAGMVGTLIVVVWILTIMAWRKIKR